MHSPAKETMLETCNHNLDRKRTQLRDMQAQRARMDKETAALLASILSLRRMIMRLERGAE